MRCRWYLGMSIDGNNQYVLSGWPTGVAFLFCESNSLRRSNLRVVEEIYSVCQFIGLTFSARREHMLRQGPSKRRNSATCSSFGHPFKFVVVFSLAIGELGRQWHPKIYSVLKNLELLICDSYLTWTVAFILNQSFLGRWRSVCKLYVSG